MKLFIKLMVFVVVAAVAGPFFLTGPDGRPLMSLGQIHAPDLTLPDLDLKKILPGTEEKTTQEDGKQLAPVEVYKWQDAAGIWHFSDNKTPEQDVKKVKLDTNVQIVQMEQSQSPQLSSTATTDGAEDPGTSALIPVSIPLEKVTQLISDSKQIEQQQIQRLEAQENALPD